MLSKYEHTIIIISAVTVHVTPPHSVVLGHLQLYISCTIVHNVTGNRHNVQQTADSKTQIWTATKDDFNWLYVVDSTYTDHVVMLPASSHMHTNTQLIVEL